MFGWCDVRALTPGFAGVAVAAAAMLSLAACSGSGSVAPGSGGAATVPGETMPVDAQAVESDPGSVIAGAPPLDEAGVVPEGFTTVVARVTEADGSTCEVCLWLADDSTERGRGLMGVTDLGDAHGMVFRFEAPVDGAFFMFQTVTPLSIAWFAPDGTFAASADMAPCSETDSTRCERFSPGTTYQLAIEVFQGDLDSIGITADASVELLPETEAPHCPLAVN